MNAAARVLNRIVRAYLRHVPVTEGKSQLLRLMRSVILPDLTIATFPMRHGFSLRGNLRNPEHLRMYFYGDHDERYEVNNVSRLLRAGDVCWDIGANIGFYTCLFASLVGPSGHVVAFEPLPQTADFLDFNVRLNGLTNVTVIVKAVGAVAGKQSIYFGDSSAGEGTASLAHIGPDWNEALVEVDAIDNMSMSLPPPDFVKIDVEGCQLDVLRGGAEFFSRRSPMLMAELRDSDSGIMEATETYLRQLGYQIYEFSKHSLKECNDTLRSSKRNFFMIKLDSPYVVRLRSILGRATK